MRGAPVIVKGKGRHAARGDYGGDVLWEEMIYLEALRGEPGIVPLHGAWFSDDARHVSFVVGDCGPPIGKTFGTSPRACRARSTARAEETAGAGEGNSRVLAWSRAGRRLALHRRTPARLVDYRLQRPAQQFDTLD